MNGESSAIVRQPPVAGSEVDTLLGALQRQRGYVAWKCGNLDSAGLRATLKPSAMTLGGLLKHLALVADAIAEGGLDRLASFSWPDGRIPSLRRLIIDTIEEYARHVGHADLIRESVDGLVGEDPPADGRPGSSWL
jgi:uncharacterized protein DUF664